MNLIEFVKITQNKSTALEFMCDNFEKKKPIRCPHCKSKNRYILSREILQCMKCKKDYKPFYATWIYDIRIDPIKWPVLIKMFDIGTSARCATMEANVSYPTALYAFDCMCYAILESSYVMDRKIRGKFELDETYFGDEHNGNRDREAKNKIMVFGILEKKGSVRVEIVKNVKARTLLKKTVKKVKKGRNET